MTNDRYQDLVTEGIDVAFRLGALPDSSAMACKIMHLPKVLVAPGLPTRPRSAHYALRPCSPLGDHRSGALIVNFLLAQRWPCHLSALASQLAITISEGATASAAAGLGIAASSETTVRAELATRRLVRVLPEWDFGSMEVNALFIGGKTTKPAARAFADFLARGLGPPRGASVRRSGAPESVSVRPNQ